MRDLTEYEKRVKANQQFLMNLYSKAELAYQLAKIELVKEAYE
jgi:hypothetical protein